MDSYLFLAGKRVPGIPPTRLMVGGKRTVEEFLNNGEEFFHYQRDLCGLLPHERVLDVGCGIGQKMFPLLAYLTDEGSYEGFDINARRIGWLSQHITSSYPNFRFQTSDIYNRHYNPRGTFRPVDYRFPFNDGSFDFILCASVFTHMLAGDMKHYLSEMERVLRPGGRCLVSFFLLTEESRSLMQEGKSGLSFRFQLDDCLSTDRLVPEAAIAFDETAVRNFFRMNRLAIQEPIHYGSWCGRKQFLSYQDIVVAVKGEDT